MKVFINDVEHQVEEGLTVRQLLEALNLIDLRGWAVAINEQIVQRDLFADFVLSPKDRILLVLSLIHISEPTRL